MNLYQYYEQKNTDNKPAAVKRAYNVINTITQAKFYSDLNIPMLCENFDPEQLVEALVIMHLVAESRKLDYLRVKAQLEDLLAANKAAPQQDLDNLQQQ